jgi:hypothetical protein
VAVFQNCFMHHTWNNTPHDRVLLYFDFWHPDLSVDEQRALRAFEAARRAFGGANNDAAPTLPPAQATPPTDAAPSVLGRLPGFGQEGGLGGDFELERGAPPPPGQIVSAAASALLAAHWPCAVARLCRDCPPAEHSLAEFKAAGRASELWHWLALQHGGDRAAMDRALRNMHDSAFSD